MPVDANMIPMSVAPDFAPERIPLPRIDTKGGDDTKPFPNVDINAAQTRAMMLEAKKGEAREQLQQQQDLERDKMVLDQYRRSGGKGDFVTPEGLAQTIADNQGSLSLNTVTQLSDLAEKRKLDAYKMAGEIARTGSDVLKAHSEKLDYGASVMMPALTAYDQTLAATKDPGKAQADYETLRKLGIDHLSQLQDPVTKKPLFDPQVLQQLNGATPQQMRNLLGSTGYAVKRMQAELAAREKTADIRLKEAETQEKGVEIPLKQAETYKAIQQGREAARKASGAGEGAGRVVPHTVLVDGVPTEANFDSKTGTYYDLNGQPIPGGKIKPTTGAMSPQVEQQVKRTVTAADDVAQTLSDVATMPVHASTGIYGFRTDKEEGSLFTAPLSVLAREMTSNDVQLYKSTVTGMRSALATLGTGGSGRAMGVVMRELDALDWKEGDSNLSKMNKLARAKEIFESGVKPFLEDPKVPDYEKASLQKAQADVQSAVPYSVKDVLKLSRDGKTLNKGISGDMTAAQVWGKEKPAAAPGAAPARPADIQKLLDKYPAKGAAVPAAAKPSQGSYDSEGAVKVAFQSGELDEAGAVKALVAMGYPEGGANA